jgi:outer membrane protein assembly factor BamB
LLYAPQGREAPLQFQLGDGKHLGTLKDGFGAFCVLTPDDRLLHGPRKKGGGIVDSDAKTRSAVATHKQARAMIVSDGRSLMMTRSELIAADLTRRAMLWKSPVEDASIMILAGDYVVLGGKDRVTALALKTGEQIWQASVDGRVYGLVVANGALVASTDTGQIVCFRAGGTAIANNEGQGEPTVRNHSKPKPIEKSHVQLAAGLWIQFDTHSSAIIRWETEEKQPSNLTLTDERGRVRVFARDVPTTEHQLRLDQLARDRRYAFFVQVGEGATRDFELDTYFNYHLAAIPAKLAPSNPASVLQATTILGNYGRKRGLCIVVGSGTGELAIELARRGGLRVIGLDTNEKNIFAARTKAMAAGVHGPRCSFVQVESMERLPAPSFVANLVVSQTAIEGSFDTPLDEVERILQPGTGKVILLGDKDDVEIWTRLHRELPNTKLAKSNEGDDGSMLIATRGALPDAGDWTHMYGDATNAAYTGEALGGITEVDQLEASWLGMPGPRYQTDRQNRKSAPLSAGGRLYMQGQERVIALDAYNGQILWSLELPGMLRFNIPRDASNWCCDEEHLFIAIGDRCLQVDGETGALVKQHRLPKLEPSPAQNWGYIARSGDWIIGSTVRPNSTFDEFWGVDFWFDQHDGKYTNQVCSDSLFARRTSDSDVAWRYEAGLIWNATITASRDQLYFLESRAVGLTADDSSRVPVGELVKECWMVGLDLKTGKRLWQQQVELSPKTSIANMALGNDALILVTSFGNKFPVRAFSASDGKPLWDTTVPWPRNHHGGHLSRPAIVGEKLFVRPAVLDMASGKLLSSNMPGGGCGTYVCSKHALFFRAGSQRQLSTWHPETGSYTHWARMRPDCWLSTIPAGGMLLSPEGGGGCSCGHWMEMSVGFVPRSPTSPRKSD